jgi:hypothetical protein
VVTTLAAGLASPTVAGDDVFIAADHVEPPYAVATTLTALGTASLPTRIMVADHTAALVGGNPPVSALVHTPTVTISSNAAAANIILAGVVSHCEGITFSAGTAALQANVHFNGIWYLKNCAIILNNTSGTSQVRVTSLGSTRTTWENVTVTFGNTGQYFAPASGEFLWINTPNAITGTLPNNLFSSSSYGMMTFRGVDLSSLTGKTLLQASHAGGALLISLIGCKEPTAWTRYAATQTSDFATIITERSENGALNYTKVRETFYGVQTTETTVVRTGGATDGTTPTSWKIDTATGRSGRVKPQRPFKSSPIIIWNDVISTNRTVTVYGIAAALPTNADIWLEVEYPGSGASPILTTANTTIDTPLSTPASVATDASSWGGSTTPFKLVATLNGSPWPQPGMKGPMTIRVCVGGQSIYYIDWQPVIS